MLAPGMTEPSITSDFVWYYDEFGGLEKSLDHYSIVKSMHKHAWP